MSNECQILITHHSLLNFLKYKIILLSILYVGLAVGLPGLLALVLWQSEEKVPPELKAGWQIRTSRLVIEPQGQFFLPTPSAFAVHRGPVTLLIYPTPDRAYNLQSQLINEGTSASTGTSYRYVLANQQSTAVEIVMTQAIAPGEINTPTVTPRASGSRNFKLEIMEQHFEQVLPGRNDLEQVANRFRMALLSKGP